MSNGGGDTARRVNHVAFNDALTALSHQITLLEDLLREIQGGDVPPPEPKTSPESKQRVISLMEFLQTGEERVHKLTDRVASTRNTIKESIF